MQKRKPGKKIHKNQVILRRVLEMIRSDMVTRELRRRIKEKWWLRMSGRRKSTRNTRLNVAGNITTPAGPIKHLTSFRAHAHDAGMTEM
jgi:hypothetical protein